jgi:hypothetical protein
MAVGVLQRELRLADPAQAVQGNGSRQAGRWSRSRITDEALHDQR